MKITTLEKYSDNIIKLNMTSYNKSKYYKD